jgi:hypothetical protein
VTATEQRRAALEIANERRAAVAAYKRALRGGELPLAQVMLDPPADLAEVPLVDLARWSRGQARNNAWFVRMGQAALRERVNLMLPLGRASVRTREWVAEYAGWHRPSSQHVAAQCERKVPAFADEPGRCSMMALDAR